MKHVPNGREKKKQPGMLTQGPNDKTARAGIPELMKKEHSQQQADKYECDQAAKEKRVQMFHRVRMRMRRGQVSPGSHPPLPPPEVQEGRDRIRRRSNPEVPAEQQWDAEARGPKHDGAYVEQVTRSR